MMNYEVIMTGENPFVQRPIRAKTIIEADSKEEVRRFFQEAKANNVKQVRGMRITSIKEAPNA